MVVSVYTLFASHHLAEDSCDLSQCSLVTKAYLMGTFEQIMHEDLVIGDLIINMENGKLIFYKISSLCEGGFFVHHDKVEHKVTYERDVYNVLYSTSKTLNKNFYTKATVLDIKKALAAWDNNTEPHKDTVTEDDTLTSTTDTCKESIKKMPSIIVKKSQNDIVITSSKETRRSSSLRIDPNGMVSDTTGYLPRRSLRQEIQGEFSPHNYAAYENTYIYSDRPFRSKIARATKRTFSMRKLFLAIITCGMLE